MRKYVSLGSALLMGVVLGKENKKPVYESLAKAPAVLGLDTLPPTTQTAQTQLKRAYSIPSAEYDEDFEVEAQRDASPVTSECTTVNDAVTSEGTSIEVKAERSATTSYGTVSPASPANIPQNVKLITEIYCGVNVAAVPGY